MLRFADATGEALAAILRPGNPTANSIADQLAALDAALAQLPAEIGVGHQPGDEAALVRRAVRVRADPAGCSPKLATALRDRNVGFAVVARTNAQVQGAISRAIDSPGRWAPALTQGAEVLAVRSEGPHSGLPRRTASAVRSARPVSVWIEHSKR